MDSYTKTNFETEEVTALIKEIVEEVANYDVIDFISRVAGLNLLSENQNKALLTDTLIQYIISNSKEKFKSHIKMSNKKFRMLIESLNNSFLVSSVDPCENTYVQNIMLNGNNYLVFNGVEITPAYNLQSLIRVLFGYKNDYNSEYLIKVNRLFALLLTISNEIAQKINAKVDAPLNITGQKLIIPSSEIINCNSNHIRIAMERFRKDAGDFFDLEDICSDFGATEKGDINNRPFYSAPFLFDETNDEILILNISLLPAFAFHKAIEWAEQYSLKGKVINKYNDYLWMETKVTLDKMGHKKIQENAYGITCVANEYYKEGIFTVYNNQLLFVFFFCDDGNDYSHKTMHDICSEKRHADIFDKRKEYYREKLVTLSEYSDEFYVMYIICSIGRGIRIGVNNNPFSYRPIMLTPFELHCVYIHERENSPFFPRYLCAKNKLNTSFINLFSELNTINFYVRNNNSFYCQDDIDLEQMNVYIEPGDSASYIAESLIREKRILVDSYIEGNKNEVVLHDIYHNIFVEDKLISENHFAMCAVFDNIKIWIKTDEINDRKSVDIYYSLVDSISYWLAECKSIIETYDSIYSVYTINVSLSGDIEEFYQERKEFVPFEKCIKQSVEKNNINLLFFPESYWNLNCDDNTQEKELMRYILKIFDNIENQNRSFADLLDCIFENPLKKKFYSANCEHDPYLRPLDIMNYRCIHSEDEDKLLGWVGNELLKSGKWQIGMIDDDQKCKITNAVVDILYSLLVSKLAEFKSQSLVEIVYHDLEETLYRLMLAERRFYSDLACYPEKEDKLLLEYNNLNKLSLSLKFLIEYITACPPHGTKYIGIGQYEELLAICSMIIEWAYKGDLFYYNIINTPVELLGSKRIGMTKDQFIEMYNFSDSYRRRQLKYDSSTLLRKTYDIKNIDFSAEMETAFLAEFGYSYSVFCNVIVSMTLIDDSEITIISKP